MTPIRTFFVALMVLLLPVAAQAGMMFSKDAFQQAQAMGKPILVEVTAPWCPTCQKQRPVIDQLTMKSEFKDLAVFQVDFDSSKDLLRELAVSKQSTLIVYIGEREVARSTGETRPEAIEALLKKAMM